MANLSIGSTIKLRDGHEIPVLGFGTYELDGKDAYEGVTSALEAGYRHIDSAAWYENEQEVGQAILDFCKASEIPRKAIFYTTKLKLNDGYDNVKKAIQLSLDTCGLGYIDLYLIHGPLGGSKARKDSWKAICDFQKESPGLLKSIGISTFGVRHMKEIMDLGLAVPAVHQIDLHPFMARSEIVAFSKSHGMVMEAWAPLVRALRFDHPIVKSLAEKYKKQPAQVLLRYSLQKGYVPLPKSSSKQRVASNADIFDFSLTEVEVSKLDDLDENLVTDWNPVNEP